MELWNNRQYRDPDKLYSHIQDSINKGCKVVLIDEVQDIQEWYEVVRSLIAEQNCDIYLTGSNSKLLSGEYASLLTGRCNLIDTFTLTYSECTKFNEKYHICPTDEVFSRFLHVGGFPSVWKNHYTEQDSISEVGDISNAILMKDIVMRYSIRKADLLHRILRYIADNIGNRTSIINIYNALCQEDRKLSKDPVYEYVNHLESACLIYKAETLDIKGKKILTTQYKYYLADLGIKNALCGFRPDDIQGYVENILYLEMRARGYNVWIGDYSGKEIDLVCVKGSEHIYLQATTRLSDEKVVEREFGNLLAVKDQYPKYVVVLEKSPLDSDIDGIQCVSLEEFLSKDTL